MSTDSFAIKFLLQLQPDIPTSLREAQTKAMELSGATLESARRISGRLAREGYVLNRKVGRSYTSVLTPSGVDYLTGLLEEPTPKSTPPMDERGLYLRQRIDRKNWSELMRITKKLGLKTVFVPNSTNKVVAILDDGSKHVVPSN